MEIDGLEQDLETAYLTCRKSYTEPPVFQKSLGHGISKTGEGQYVFRVAPEDTEPLEPGKYHYDVQIGANGDVFTVLDGILEIRRDVTV
jgi:hypothetical protein